MKILILSFYYRPDLCAGSFRATALVEQLRHVVPAGAQIDVISTVPNRYHTYTADAPREERHAGLRINRIAIPGHKSGMRDQSRAFLAFARGAARLVADRRYDLVLATSSRLMTAALGSWVARRTGARLYLDIRDIFADTIGDVLPRSLGSLLEPGLSALERWTVRGADTVNLVSPGFGDYFRARYGRKRLRFFTNGIDDEFVAAANQPPRARATAEALPLVLYAGNLGEGQGMHTILPGLARRMAGRARFRVIGDGGRRRVLEQSVADLSNVELLPPMPRDKLIAEYRNANVLFLHLNDYKAFEKVLPSKIFEYAAMGKPVLAGVSGYSAEFVRREVDNAAVFQPCDVDGAVAAFEALQLVDTPRKAFTHKYARATICQAMARDIVGRGIDQSP